VTEQDSRPEFFISYSRTDANLVGPVVALLRASRAHVFRDADSLQPGKKWREQLSTAISDAKVVVLFWCHHADKSVEVRNEYSEAITKGKDLLPLLLDDTPLPANLAEYQFIDFRGAFPHGHALVAEASPQKSEYRRVSAPEGMPRARRGTWITAMAAGVLVFVSLPVIYLMTQGGPKGGIPTPGPDDLPPLLGGARDDAASFLPWILAAVIVVAGIFFWRRRRKRAELVLEDSMAAAPPAIPQAHVMASTIEDELRRRLANL
jgi:TIR domain-containing protein